jgi:hypothetical protein
MTQSALPRHPIRFTGALFLGLTIYVFAFLPFMPKQIWAEPATLILTVIGFNLGLAFGAVGLLFANRSKWFNLWVRVFIFGGKFVLFLGLALIGGLCWLSLKGHLNLSLADKILGWVILPLYWFSRAFIVLIALIAVRGWVDHFWCRYT